MTAEPGRDPRRLNTVAMLGQAYSLLGFRIVDGVVGAGYPLKPHHSAVFAQIGPGGSRLTQLAAGAGMTPQSMQQIVDELERLDYVRREPDPSDRRAKLIVLTERGWGAVRAGEATVQTLESDIDALLGEEDAAHLRRILAAVVASGGPPPGPPGPPDAPA